MQKTECDDNQHGALELADCNGQVDSSMSSAPSKRTKHSHNQSKEAIANKVCLGDAVGALFSFLDTEVLKLKNQGASLLPQGKHEMLQTLQS